MNRNPESIRLEKVREEQNRLNLKAYQMNRDAKPRKMPEQLRREALLRLIERTHPDKPVAWKRQRLQELLGGQPAKKPAPAPIWKKSTPLPAEIRERVCARNKEIAARFGIKEPGNIQYR